MACFDFAARTCRAHARLFLALAPIAFAATATAQTMLWVSPNGDDSWSGTLSSPNGLGDGPKKTLNGAQYAIRALKLSGRLSPKGAIVTVRPGRYIMLHGFYLNGLDSGAQNAKIVWRSEVVHGAVIYGAREITSWLPPGQRPPLNQFPLNAQGKIQVADLKANGITEAGYLSHSAPNYETVPTWADLYFDGQRMTLARWPNKHDNFITGIGANNSWDTPEVTADLHSLKTPDFTNSLNGDANTDYWVQGTFNDRLYNMFQEKVRTIDKVHNLLGYSIVGGNVDDGARRAAYDPVSTGRFCLVNSMYELDTPGEYYIDRDKMLLYFWPTASFTGRKCYLTMNPNPMIEMVGAKYVDIQGFTIEGGRQDGVDVQSGYCNYIRGNLIRNCGGTGVYVNQGSSVTVRSNDIEYVGEGGIDLEGGDRTTLRHANHLAENNRVFNAGQFQPYYHPGIKLWGCGLTARNNDISYHKHQAIYFWGNDILIEKNRVSFAVTDACDAAAIYAGIGDWTSRGNVIRYNYISDIQRLRVGYHGVHGVYLDDMYSSADIYGNVFRNVVQPIQVGGGHDNSVVNNVFVDCVGGVRIDDRGVSADQGWIDRFFVQANLVPWQNALWKNRYPSLYALLTGNYYRQPSGNSIVGNVALRSTTDQHISGPYELWGMNNNGDPFTLVFDNNLATTTQQFVDEPHGNFTALPLSQASSIGFPAVSAVSMGVVKDSYIDPNLW